MKDHVHVFGIVRFDVYPNDTASLQDRLQGKTVFLSEEDAEKECVRLRQINTNSQYMVLLFRAPKGMLVDSPQNKAEPTVKKVEEPIVSGSMAVPSWANLSAEDRRAEAGMYSRLFLDEMSSFEDD